MKMHANTTIYFPDSKRVDELRALATVKGVSLSVLLLDLIERGIQAGMTIQLEKEQRKNAVHKDNDE